MGAIGVSGTSPTQRYTLQTVRVRLAYEAVSSRLRIDKPEDAAAILTTLYADLDADQEHVVILTLDAKHQVTGFKHIASGGQASTLVDAKVLFRAALALGASSIILSHNHPTGDTTPSPEDVRLTRQLVEASTSLSRLASAR